MHDFKYNVKMYYDDTCLQSSFLKQTVGPKNKA